MFVDPNKHKKYCAACGGISSIQRGVKPSSYQISYVIFAMIIIALVLEIAHLLHK